MAGWERRQSVSQQKVAPSRSGAGIHQLGVHVQAMGDGRWWGQEAGGGRQVKGRWDGMGGARQQTHPPTHAQHPPTQPPTLGSLTFLRTMSRYLARSSCWPACTRRRRQQQGGWVRGWWWEGALGAGRGRQQGSTGQARPVKSAIIAVDAAAAAAAAASYQSTKPQPRQRAQHAQHSTPSVHSAHLVGLGNDLVVLAGVCGAQVGRDGLPNLRARGRARQAGRGSGARGAR